MTIKQHLDSLFTGRKVKIVIGHPSNDTYIIGTVTGFVENTYTIDTQRTLILLKDVTVNKEQYQEYCANGKFNKLRVKLDTDIELLRDTNLEAILNSDTWKEK